MTDVFSREKRSEIMSRIRSKDTVAEKIVFKELRLRKIYFQKHYPRVPGKPDIAQPRKKKAVFIDGDFWHGRDIKRVEKSRGKNDYWTSKLKSNALRDRQQTSELLQKGWSVLRVWESDIKRKRTRDKKIDEISNFLSA